jgi:hypothetical protein
MGPSSHPRPSPGPDPLFATNEVGVLTSSTGDSHDDNTAFQDPLLYVTTLIYNTTGRGQTDIEANDDTTTHLPGSQGRKRGRGKKRERS